MDFKAIDPEKEEIVLANKYLLKERLGSGSFGQIFRVENRENEAQVAAKLEKRGANATLVREAKVISDLRGQNGFPSLYDYGKEEDYNFIIVSLLGLNLEKLFKLCSHKFSLKTVLMIAEQMLSRIEVLHSKNYIHRDIKPENFCIGRNSSSKNIYLIDYGLAKTYKDPTGKHASFKENKSLVGTARYASLNAHLGYEQSRRDDLEAIGYTFVYFLLGSLPWQNLKVEEKHQKYQKIADLKSKIPTDQLCQGLPSQFATYLNYVKNLEFMEEPDYKYIKKLFRTLFIEKGYELDYQYDWCDLIKLPNTLEIPPRHKLELKVSSPLVEKGLFCSPSPLKSGMALSPYDKRSAQKNPSISIAGNSPLLGPKLESSERKGEGVEEGIIPVFIPLNASSAIKGVSMTAIRKASSPRKRNTVFQDSLAKNMSMDSLHSKTMNMSDKICAEEEVIPFEGKMDSPIAGAREKGRRFTVRKEGIVLGGNGTLIEGEGNNGFQRTKTKNMTYFDIRHVKRNPHSHFSVSDPIFLTTRKAEIPKKDGISNEDGIEIILSGILTLLEGNLNESSICEWNENNNLDLMISQRRSFVYVS